MPINTEKPLTPKPLPDPVRGVAAGTPEDAVRHSRTPQGNQPDPGPASGTADSQFTELLKSVSVLGSDCFRLLLAEWSLAKSTFFLIILASVVFAVFIAATWGLFIVLLAWSIYQQGVSLGLVIGIVFTLQVIALLLTWKALQCLFSAGSFNRTTAMIQQFITGDKRSS